MKETYLTLIRDTDEYRSFQKLRHSYLTTLLNLDENMSLKDGLVILNHHLLMEYKIEKIVFIDNGINVYFVSEEDQILFVLKQK